MFFYLAEPRDCFLFSFENYCNFTAVVNNRFQCILCTSIRLLILHLTTLCIKIHYKVPIEPCHLICKYLYVIFLMIIGSSIIFSIKLRTKYNNNEHFIVKFLKYKFFIQ